MRQSIYSLLRANARLLVLTLAILGMGLYASHGWAQDQAAPPAAAVEPEPEQAAPAKGKNVFQLVLGRPDFITLTIGVLSVVSLTLIIQGFLRARPTVLLPPESIGHLRDLINEKKYKELLEFTQADPSFVSRALHPALRRAPDFANMKEAMETAIGEETAEQFRKIEPLNIIGNLGPLLGLLGTVLGMVESFSAMQAQGGNADPSVLSGGIATALSHTFLGLFLAVPCLAAFGILRTMLDRLTTRGALVAEELLMWIRDNEVRTDGGLRGEARVDPRTDPRPAGAAAPRSQAPAPVLPRPTPAPPAPTTL